MFNHSLSRIENIIDEDYFNEAPYPNCFGNLLSPQVVLTTLSCFRKVREVNEYFGERYLLRRKKFQGFYQETDPTEIIVAKVIVQMIDFSKEFPCHMHSKTEIHCDEKKTRIKTIFVFLDPDYKKYSIF